jgi:hypothetical protein
MTDRELMQEALYALTYVGDAKEIYSDTIESLRARLAQPEQEHSEQWWKHEVSNAYANGYEKGRASVKQPEQEPVAWADKYDIERDGHDFWVSRQQPAKNGVPLYTAPPQREWQGLTDEEMFSLWVRCPAETEDRFAFARAIEAKLKEKNEMR